MLRKLSLLKVLTLISYLLIVLVNDKNSLLMFMYLLLALFNTGVVGFVTISITLIAVFYLLLSVNKKYDSKKKNLLSILSIVFLYSPFIWDLSTDENLSNYNLYFVDTVPKSV